MEELVRKIIEDKDAKVFYNCIYENADGTYKYYDGNYFFKRFETFKEAVEFYLGKCTAPAPEERPYIKVGGFRWMKSYNKRDIYWFMKDCGLNARESFYFFEEVGLV